MKRTFIAIFLFLVYGVITAIGLYAFYPWKEALEPKIIERLEAEGLTNVSLKLSSVGPGGLTVQDLRFGQAGRESVIPKLWATYTLDTLRAGKVDSLVMRAVHLRIRQAQEGWTMDGFVPAKETDQAFVLPVTQEFFDGVRVDDVALTQGHLEVLAKDGILNMPLDVAFAKQDIPNFSLKPAKLSFKGDGVRVSGVLKGEMRLEEDKAAWKGQWSLKDVSVLQQGHEFPKGLMAGKIHADQKALRIDGGITGEHQAYTGTFSYTYPFAAPGKATLVVNGFSMPWFEGVVSAHRVNVPLSGKADYTLNLQVHRASIGKLIQAVTGEHVKATGTISGSIPVRIKPDGTIVIGKGSLKAAKPGVLSFPAQLLPGAGAQMDLTREILKDFRYERLTLTTETKGKDGLILHVMLEGNNPKVQSGRAVKLNINLSGDVLDFVTSSAIVFSNPKALLSKERQ
jgi:hypothetical protein